MLDATEGEVQNQDLKIAALAWESGRALIMVINKWDIAEKVDMAAAKYEKTAVEKAPFLGFVPFLFTSAKTGQRVHKALDLILEVQKERTRRIDTHEVNEALQALVQHQPPPHSRGRAVKLRYGTQATTKPPTFVIFSNLPREIPDHYLRYLINGFRERWGFQGSPIRIQLRGPGRGAATT